MKVSVGVKLKYFPHDGKFTLSIPDSLIENEGDIESYITDHILNHMIDVQFIVERRKK